MPHPGQVRFRHGKGHVDGSDLVQLHQVGRVVRLHQIAEIDHQRAGAGVDGGDDIGVLQLHACGLGGRLVGVHRRCIRLGLRRQLAGLFVGDNAFLFQAGVALRLNARILRLGLIVFHLANGFFEVCLERPLVELKQLLALRTSSPSLKKIFWIWPLTWDRICTVW